MDLEKRQAQAWILRKKIEQLNLQLQQMEIDIIGEMNKPKQDVEEKKKKKEE